MVTRETKLEKAAREHETNELPTVCRDIEKLTVVGWDVQKAYRFVKEKYSRGYVNKDDK